MTGGKLAPVINLAQIDQFDKLKPPSFFIPEMDSRH